MWIMDENIRLNIREHTKLTARDLMANVIMLGASVALVAFLVWVFYL